MNRTSTYIPFLKQTPVASQNSKGAALEGLSKQLNPYPSHKVMPKPTAEILKSHDDSFGAADDQYDASS